MFNKMMGEKVQQNDDGKGSTKWWLKSQIQQDDGGKLCSTK